MAFRKTGIALCCIGNVNRALPNYVYNMFMKKGDTYAALLYGDCTLTDGDVTIKQKTAYPFDETVTFSFTVAKEKAISFACRIPAWCKNYNVLINGKKANIIGRICMDQMSVDVSDIPNVKMGDEVILFGKDLKVDTLADICGTINYEIICGISPRVPRIVNKG